MGKKEIAIIGLKGLPAYGGAARSFESILGILKEDFNFTVYSVNTHTKGENTVHGINQIVFKGYRNNIINIFMYYLKSMAHAILFANYDIIHLNHAESGFVTPFLKLKYFVIITVHGIYNNEKYDTKFSKLGNLSFRLFQYLNFKFSDLVISVSNDDMQFIKKRTKKHPYWIPNGVFQNEKVAEIDLQFRDYILFSAGRIYGIKGCHTFLEALGIMNYKGKILIIGDLNHDHHYKSEILEMATNLDVTFIDIIRDKPLLMRHIQNSWFFVFPSFYEAMSNMLLEVASMGTPILCSNINGNTEIFNDTEVTFFKVGDANDLALKIHWAMNHKKDLVEKAGRAKTKVIKEYSWAKISAQYKQVYNASLQRCKQIATN